MKDNWFIFDVRPHLFEEFNKPMDVPIPSLIIMLAGHTNLRAGNKYGDTSETSSYIPEKGIARVFSPRGRTASPGWMR